MKKRKVLFLIESFIVGGAEKVLIDIANNLNQEKYDITVCSIFKESVYSDYRKKFSQPFAKNVRYRYLINNNIPGLSFLFNYLVNRIPSFLFHLLVRKKYDKVIAFYEGRPTQWIAQVKLEKEKKLAWLHTSTKLSQQGKSEMLLKREEQYYVNYSAIIAVSEEVKVNFIHVFPTLKEKVRVIYNPIDTVAIRQKSLMKLNMPSVCNRPLFVCVGRITEAKGYKRLLEIIKDLSTEHKNFQFWIVGGGNAQDLLEYIRENNLEQYITLLGHQSNPYPFMRAADCIVIPSYIEGLSTVALETFILGKPIISTHCGGSKELLGDSNYGILAENSKESLQKALEYIIDTPSALEYFSQMSENRGRNLNLDKSINLIEQALDI